MAAGDSAASSDAAEIPWRTNWCTQKIQESSFSQTAHSQEGRTRVPGRGCRAAQTCYWAAEYGSETARAGTRQVFKWMEVVHH